MGLGRYILVDRHPKLEPDLHKWGRWMETADRKVRWTDLPNGVSVSTVFLGMDHSFGGGPPLLFETMIFGGNHDRYHERYSTWAEAEAGHEKALRLARGFELKVIDGGKE